MPTRRPSHTAARSRLPAGCKSYDNTATFTTNDNGYTGSDSKTVQVCEHGYPGALTIGFWKGPNGNTLIQYFCAQNGKQTLAAYLIRFGHRIRTVC